MNFKDEYMQIVTADVDSVHGAKPEPEERPARRVLVSDGVPISLNDANHTRPSDVSDRHGDRLPGTVAASSTVGKFANRMKLCGGCKHFDRNWWLKELERMTLSDDPAERQFVTTIYAEFSMQTHPQLIEMHQGDDGEGLDTEHAVKAHGVCKAYTHLLHELGYSDFDAITIVHPIGTCPDMNMKTNPPSPWPGLAPGQTMYAPASNEAEQKMNQLRDNLLLTSEGKIR